MDMKAGGDMTVCLLSKPQMVLSIRLVIGLRKSLEMMIEQV